MSSAHKRPALTALQDSSLCDPIAVGLRRFIFCLLFVFLSCASASLAAEDTPSAPPATFGAWEIRCSNPAEDAPARTCAAVLEFLQSESQQKFLAWSIVKQSAGTFATQVLTPIGVVIPPGVRISVAGDAQVYRLLFQSCGQGGCSASGEMPQEMLTSLLSADTATIVFSLTAGKDIRVDFPLFDIAGALAAL